MTSLPKITIITPSFNQGAYLKQTIESVLMQQYPNLEYFVIDGGSTDNSVDVIKQYSQMINWWVSEKDNGQTHAINKGLSRATGDIIAFLNSDDIYFADTLFNVATHFTNSNTQWLVGTCVQIDTQSKPIGQFNHTTPDSFSSYLMRDTGLLPQPSSFWSAQTFERLGHFRTDIHCSFDYEWNCRLLANNFAPQMVHTPYAGFRIHPESKGQTLDLTFGRDRIQIASEYANYLPLDQQKALRKRLAYNTRQYAILESQLTGNSLWKQILKRPWWIGSQQIRNAIFNPTPASKAA